MEGYSDKTPTTDTFHLLKLTTKAGTWKVTPLGNPLPFRRKALMQTERGEDVKQIAARRLHQAAGEMPLAFGQAPWARAFGGAILTGFLPV